MIQLIMKKGSVMGLYGALKYELGYKIHTPGNDLLVLV